VISARKKKSMNDERLPISNALPEVLACTAFAVPLKCPQCGITGTVRGTYTVYRTPQNDLFGGTQATTAEMTYMFPSWHGQHGPDCTYVWEPE